MATRFRRLWSTLWGKLLIIGSFGTLILIGGTVIAVKATEGNRFCGTKCHEMTPYSQAWVASKHANVDCVKCHIPPGLTNLAKTKLFALREIKVHFFGGPKLPIKATRHIQDSICQGCHSPASLTTPVELTTSSFSHAKHVKAGMCVDCHSQVVHHPIDGVEYVPPRAMAACYSCHDGKRQPNNCNLCHSAPHPDRGASCDTCHAETSWLPRDFTHPEPLSGKHAESLCESCHTRGVTMKGVKDANVPPADGCINCHNPPHPDRGRCDACHSITSWNLNFHHPQPLVGGHLKNTCESCHTGGITTAGLAKHNVSPADGCIDCHKHPHPNRGTCTGCHTIATWNINIHHPQPLVGGHLKNTCESCHTGGITAASLAHRNVSPADGCTGCHKRPHPNRGTCASCHSITSWRYNFHHPQPLTNKHASTVCESCHTGGITRSGASQPNGCVNCHGNKHSSPQLTLCIRCHVLSHWVPSTFVHKQVGEHIPNGEKKLACIQCHTQPLAFAVATCSCHGNNPPGRPVPKP
jgi:nitrate/TMAO reductase-like tetraheme cytochrome c subunit